MIFEETYSHLFYLLFVYILEDKSVDKFDFILRSIYKIWNDS